MLVAAVCLVLATACATSAGNISHRLAELRYYRPDRPSSCVRFATTRSAYAKQPNLFSSVFDLGAVPATLDELMLERLDGRGDLMSIAIQRSQGRCTAVALGCTTPVRGRCALAADRHHACARCGSVLSCVSMQVMACGGRLRMCCKRSRRQDAVLPQSLVDVQTRTRLLMEDFGVSAADLASVNIDRILALRATSPGRRY